MLLGDAAQAYAELVDTAALERCLPPLAEMTPSLYHVEDPPDRPTGGGHGRGVPAAHDATDNLPSP